MLDPHLFPHFDCFAQERYSEGGPRAGYQGHGAEHPADQHAQDRHLPGEYPQEATGCQGGQGSEGAGGQDL